jgi:hypothetical protein
MLSAGRGKRSAADYTDYADAHQNNLIRVIRVIRGRSFFPLFS